MTKEQVQDKMSEINQAYEVLSDDGNYNKIRLHLNKFLFFKIF